MATDPKRIETLVAAALRLDPVGRAALLDENFGDDASTRAWVEALIRAREQASTWTAPDDAPRSTDSPNGAPSADGDGEASGHDASRGAPPLRVHAGHDEDRPAAEVNLSFLDPPTRPDAIGRLGEYEILEVLGQGVCGVALKAFDEQGYRVVVLKVLDPVLAGSATARRYFLEEARAAAAIVHENVAGIYAVQDRPIPYVATEYVAGPSLREKLADSGPLELKQILRIGQQIAAGLAAAHRQGLLHGALKPSNVLLVGGLDRVKITDFGSLGVADGLVVSAGTPMYMAPEQVMGDEVDQRTDLFSLGTLLYMLCTGRPPFGDATSLATLKQVVERQAREIREINRDVPPWLCKIIGKLHAKMPSQRYQSAAEVADLLEKCLADLRAQGEVAGPREGSPAVAPPRRTWRAVLAVLFQVLIFAGSLAAYYYDLPPFRSSPDADSDAHHQQALDVGTLAIRVKEAGLRLTLKQLGENPRILADGTEAKTQELPLPPGRYWVQATRGEASVFEEYVDLRPGETKSVTISSEPERTNPRAGR